MKVLKKGLRRREGGRGGVQPHPSQLSLCRSASAEQTASRLLFFTHYYEV